MEVAMKFLFVLIPLLLNGGVLKEPFRIAQAELDHHQACLRAAIASDGRFAVAWVDSLFHNDSPELNESDMEFFVRFFDRDGIPLTEAYKIAKLADTNYIYGPCLDMDTLGNTVLVWSEGTRYLENTYTRFQIFAPDGNPMDSARIMCSGGAGWSSRLGLSIANNGEFAVVCPTRFPEHGYGLWVQRFDLEGVPKDSAFLAHDTGDINFKYPQVALNDAGDLVVTWLHAIESGKMYPRFQVFDANDESVLPWEPFGHPLDDGDDVAGACRPEPHWLDNDRFVVFYSDYMAPRPTAAFPFLGRVFSDKGLSAHSIKTLMWGDTLWSMGADPKGQFCTAVSLDERFAYTHTRTYCDFPDTAEPWKMRLWEHAAGILGEVVNNEPWRRTTLFEYTPSWGADTVNSFLDNWGHAQAPAVACNDEQIVWVYTRFNPDTIFEAYVLITDWDMGIGVMESPIHTASPIKLETSLNRLSYDLPGKAQLTLYSADGRLIFQEPIEGKGTWVAPIGFPSGVYFARVEGESATANRKLVVLK